MIEDLTNKLPQTTVRAFTSAEPSRRNILIATFFLLMAFISNNMQKADRHNNYDRQIASQSEPAKSSVDALKDLFTNK
jgi:hypothetical protein